MNEVIEAPGPSDASLTLDAITALKNRTRRARQGYWLPLLIFGAIIMGSAPFYVEPSDVVVGNSPGAGSAIVRTYLSLNPGVDWKAIYWLIAIPLGYLATVVWYSFRGQRRGVTTSMGAYLAAGVGFLVLVVLGAANAYVNTDIGDLVVRGLTTTLAIAAGFGVLARLERSLTLAAIAIMFAALALTANLYDLSNIAERFGWLGYSTKVNLFTLGLFLLVAGTVVGLAKRSDAR
jgi:hypothetical protein